MAGSFSSEGNPGEKARMAGVDAHVVVWILSAVQAVGLLSAWLARLSEGSRVQTSCQRFFIACLATVGFATAASAALSSAAWLICSTTLALMVLAATWDFRAHARAEAA
jgi:hypothetical protein